MHQHNQEMFGPTKAPLKLPLPFRRLIPMLRISTTPTTWKKSKSKTIHKLTLLVRREAPNLHHTIPQHIPLQHLPTESYREPIWIEHHCNEKAHNDFDWNVDDYMGIAEAIKKYAGAASPDEERLTESFRNRLQLRLRNLQHDFHTPPPAINFRRKYSLNRVEQESSHIKQKVIQAVHRSSVQTVAQELKDTHLIHTLILNPNMPEIKYKNIRLPTYTCWDLFEHLFMYINVIDTSKKTPDKTVYRCLRADSVLPHAPYESSKNSD